MAQQDTLAALSAALTAGSTTAAHLLEKALARHEAMGVAARGIFIRLDAGRALLEARHQDALRRIGAHAGSLAGLCVAIKDNIDIAGEVTTAGSVLLADAPAALQDARVVTRLRAAGLVPLGRTGMTEFAYSGLGANPHYGTPLNAADSAVARLPGGSTAGGAVAVAHGLAPAALGTDTGGSCRIPAAWNGLVGFKPTARRVPLDGVFPLSPSLDAVGVLARGVACCAQLFAIMADSPMRASASRPLSARRFAVPDRIAFDDIEPAVKDVFDAAIGTLRRAGAHIETLAMPLWDEIVAANAKGGFAAAQCYAAQRAWLEGPEAWRYDPRVSVRIAKGAQQSAADYLALIDARRRLIQAADALTAPYDALLLPTTPMVAPPLAAIAADEDYGRINLLALRNPSLANFLDRCSISLPCPVGDGLPVGLMLIGETCGDEALLQLAASVAAALAS